MQLLNEIKVDSIATITGVTIALADSRFGINHQTLVRHQYFTNWIRKSSIPITISNINRKVF